MATRIMRMLVCAFLALVIPLSLAHADTQYTACLRASDGTNTAWGQCGSAWVSREDRLLNEVWTRLVDKLDAAAKKALLDEQRAWIAYKEKSCIFYEGFGREGRVLHFPACRAQIIAQRTKDLQLIAKFRGIAGSND